MKAMIKIALLQLTAHKNDQEANLLKGDLYCRKAKELGADIILFPEMWNIGYTPFNQDMLYSDFAPEHTVTYAEDIKKWQSQAVSLDSDFIQHFKHLAKELNIAIAITYLEKYKTEARNSVSLIDRKGKVTFNLPMQKFIPATFLLKLYVHLVMIFMYVILIQRKETSK